MTERNPYSLLLYDEFQSEFVDDSRTPDTYIAIDSASWGASILYEQLYEEEQKLGNDYESLPYKIFIVGPDGSRISA